MLIRRLGLAGGSPGGDQGVKAGAALLPLLMDRDQLLAHGHPFPVQPSDPDIWIASDRHRIEPPQKWLLSRAKQKDPASGSGGD